MGSDERRSSLEAPSLGFRRRKKSPPAQDAGEEPAVVDTPLVEDAPPPTAPDDDHATVVDTPLVEEAPTAPVRREEPTVADTSRVESTPAPPAAPEPAAAPTKRPRAPRSPRRPMNGHLAAALAGLVVGVFLVAGTYGGLQGCESVRGTTSCGGGPGFLLLLLIVVLAVVIGAAVLRATQVPSAGSISFLAVALVSVLTILFLLDSLDDLAGSVVVGILSVAAYVLSHWVTVRYIDTAE